MLYSQPFQVSLPHPSSINLVSCPGCLLSEMPSFLFPFSSHNSHPLLLSFPHISFTSSLTLATLFLVTHFHSCNNNASIDHLFMSSTLGISFFICGYHSSPWNCSHGHPSPPHSLPFLRHCCRVHPSLSTKLFLSFIHHHFHLSSHSHPWNPLHPRMCEWIEGGD